MGEENMMEKNGKIQIENKTEYLKIKDDFEKILHWKGVRNINCS